MKTIGIKIPNIKLKGDKIVTVRKRADLCTELKRKANANKPRPTSRAKAMAVKGAV